MRHSPCGVDRVQYRFSVHAGIAFLAALLPLAAAHAQTDPGSLVRTVPQVETDPATRATPKIATPDVPPPSQAGAVQSFVLSAVVIDGATVLDSATLAKSFEPYLASRVGRAELELIARDITARYRAAGYLLSYAVVPAQSVQFGIAHIRVVEGYVGRVRLAADSRSASAVRDIFQTMAAERPLRGETLERAIGLGRDVPGVLIRDVQIGRSDDDPAQHVLTIVLGKDLVRAMAYSDNRGTSPGARGRAYAALTMGSLLVPGDQIQLDLFAIPYRKFRYGYGQLKGSVPIGSDGLRISAAGSYGDQFERLAGPNRHGTTRQLAGDISYPFLKSRALAITGSLQLADLKSELEQLGSVVQRDRLQVARAWIDLARVSSRTRLDARVGISQGLDLASGTDRGDPLASRPRGSTHFAKLNASVQLTAPLSKRVRFRFDSVAQYSTKPLLAPEEFALGGSRIGRAFDFNEITGDHGIGAMVELAYQLGGAKPFVDSAEVLAFADGGGAFRDRSSPGLSRERWLASIGAGTRIAAFGFLWSCEIGVPVAISKADRGVRLFFSTTKTF